VHRKFLEIIKTFEEDLNIILGYRVIDIILYGSAITGDFITGKGDVDFIVFVKGNITRIQETEIYELHEKYRNTKTLFNQLEGTFYTLNNQCFIDGGIYVGTSRKGWKRISEIIHGDIDQGMILQDYESLKSEIDLEDFFALDLSKIFYEIAITTSEFLRLMKELKDVEFNIYAIQTTARNLFTLRRKKFASKSDSIDFTINDEKFIKYRSLLLKIKPIRYPYSVEEINSISIKETELLLHEMLYCVNLTIA
jgi:predicted nucleotidyltransferase